MATNSGINLATAASGKLVQAQGVGVANGFTTATYPSVAGTAGNFLTSDGTNIVTTSMGQLQFVNVTVTSQEIKNLRATPKTIVAAPGANKIIIPVTSSYEFVYGGTSVFIAGAAQTIAGAFSTSIVTTGVLTNAQIVAAATRIAQYSPTVTNNVGVINQPFILYNTVATEISGNAEDNNVLKFSFLYYILDVS